MNILSKQRIYSSQTAEVRRNSFQVIQSSKQLSSFLFYGSKNPKPGYKALEQGFQLEKTYFSSMPTTKKGVMERRQVTLVTLDPKLTLSVVKKKSRKASTLRDFLAEKEAPELTKS